MGKILGTKTAADEKVIVTLELTKQEMLWLKGNMEKMHLFSESNLEHTTRLVQRGRKESTKYFLMPKEFRGGILPSTTVSCNKIDTKTKHIFIFSLKKY